MHQRLRVMGLTVLAVAASAVLLGGSSASHAGSLGARHSPRIRIPSA